MEGKGQEADNDDREGDIRGNAGQSLVSLVPSPEEVRQGCVAYRIAAHAADVARGLPGARDADDAISDARAAFDWKRQFDLAFDGEAAEAIRGRDCDLSDDADYCSMCGRKWCAMRIYSEMRRGAPQES